MRMAFVAAAVALSAGSLASVTSAMVVTASAGGNGDYDSINGDNRQGYISYDSSQSTTPTTYSDPGTSYSFSSAPAGATGISLQAVATAPTLSGSVTVKPSDASLHAMGTSNMPSSGGTTGYGRGQITDLITFHNTSASNQTVAVHFNLDGAYTALNNGATSHVGTLDARLFLTAHSTTAGPAYAGNSVEYTQFYGLGLPGGWTVVTPSNSPTTTTDTGTGGSATINITLAPGDTSFDLTDYLNVGGNNATTDYSNTSALSFVFSDPGLVSYSSTGITVPTNAPEPAGLMLMGLGAFALRRRA